jgi:thymidylate synthase
MRIYRNFSEALNEIKRDLAEMGIRVTTQTMQDKFRPEGFETLELQNYIYTVTDTDLSHLSPTQPWADVEFEERVNAGNFLINPGEAYKLRPEVWNQFLEYNGKKFSYTYPQRIELQAIKIIEELKSHPDSRQLFLSVWDKQVDINRLGRRRVPCTLGYYFQNRKGKLNITYLQRSADYVTHFQNDIYLAVKLLHFIADKAGLQSGTFTHWIGSLHVYKEDLGYVF